MIDLVITVMVIGIMAAVAVPRFVGSLQRYRVEAAAKRVQADLGFARRTAMARSTPLTVQFTGASHNYTIVGVDRPDRVGQAYTIQLADSPYQSIIVSAVLGGDESVQFNQYGVPDSGGTITVQSGAFQKTVTIDPETGRATIP